MGASPHNPFRVQAAGADPISCEGCVCQFVNRMSIFCYRSSAGAPLILDLIHRIVICTS